MLKNLAILVIAIWGWVNTIIFYRAFCDMISVSTGEGGLYALLRKKGWAHQLVAGHKTLAKGFSLFMVSIQLTEAGEKFTDEVILHVFQVVTTLLTHILIHLDQQIDSPCLKSLKPTLPTYWSTLTKIRQGR